MYQAFFFPPFPEKENRLRVRIEVQLRVHDKNLCSFHIRGGLSVIFFFIKTIVSCNLRMIQSVKYDKGRANNILKIVKDQLTAFAFNYAFD